MAGKAQALKQAAEEDFAISNMNSANESTQGDESGSLHGSGQTQAAQADSLLDQDAADVVDLKRRQGDWSVYSYYFKAAGKYELASFLAFMSLWTVCEQFSGMYSRPTRSPDPATLTWPRKRYGSIGGPMRMRYRQTAATECILECMPAWASPLVSLWVLPAGEFLQISASASSTKSI